MWNFHGDVLLQLVIATQTDAPEAALAKPLDAVAADLLRQRAQFFGFRIATEHSPGVAAPTERRTPGIEEGRLESGTVFGRRKLNVDLRALGGRSSRPLATDMEITEEQSMKLQDWEVTIQRIMEESNLEPRESGKSRVMTEWRAKLAQEPHLLQPFQIDEIVREVRKRLTSVSLQPSGSSLVRLASATSMGLL
jgi:hypothetical protein